MTDFQSIPSVRHEFYFDASDITDQNVLKEIRDQIVERVVKRLHQMEWDAFNYPGQTIIDVECKRIPGPPRLLK